MSRRKQAKPRPIFAFDEENGPSEDILVPISHTNGHALTTTDVEEDAEFGEFAPLVMDTTSQDVDQSTTDMDQSNSAPSPPIIKMASSRPIATSHTIRPEPLKPAVLSSINEMAVFPTNSVKSKAMSISSANIGISNVENFINSISSSSSSGNKQRLDSTTSISSVASAASALTNGSTGSDDNSLLLNTEDSKSANALIRRGTKTSDPDTEENDENVMYDSDLDDLEDLLSELVRNKILPIAGEDGEKFICPVCNVSLLNLHDLTVHIRSHNTPATGNQSNTCKICSKVLSSQSSLDRHMLVHSGERPFLCKICNMSFTTNGNMHRHSRIHTKEESLNAIGAKFQMRRGKGAWRQRINFTLGQTGSPVSDRMRNFQAVSQDILKSLPNHSQQSVFGRPTENLPSLVPGMKRQFSASDVKSEWSVPMKRPTLGSDSDLAETARQYEYQLLTPKEEPLPLVKQEEMSPEGERGDKELLHCPQCPKTFLCKYGLEAHLETHPNSSNHCNVCKLAFKNPRKLRLHQLIVHTEKGMSDATSPNQKNEELKFGFHDLSFVDFSVEKFALIAKHFLETNARTSSSVYLNFTCKLCSKAFPCESSLILHSYSHTTDKCTQCPLCECDYGDVNEFHTHMLKHLADKAFAEIRPSANGEKGEDVLPDRMTQHDFLAMFQLKEEEEAHSNEQAPSESVPKKRGLPAPKPVKSEKTTNNDYFAKLGQAFAPGVPSIFNQLPLFPQGYQPTLDDFHKMLQIATNMNMLPSMGPNFLMKGLQQQTSPSSNTSPSKTSGNKVAYERTPASSPAPAHSQSGTQGLSPYHGGAERVFESGPEKEINDIKMMNTTSFPCKYCDTSFTSYKALKAHIRSHLGPSPYQCNLCAYSSSDKSSLIRHIRTHSGERPFQCLICDFAFTTRANCERHVRKKHCLENKDDVEKSIYLNKFALATDSPMGSFHSPDTICKYCQIDFKFFRALKNHLRSHTMSRQKPFQCQLCAMSFCTRVNCLRHIHKMHPDILDNQGEFHVKTIDVSSLDDAEDSLSDDGIPLYTDDSRNASFGRSGSSTPQPPAAHSTPKPDSLLGRESRHNSPNRLVSPAASRSSLSPKPLVITTEALEDKDEAPLDFSLKQNGEDEAGEKSEETPIDLSVKKAPIAIAPKPIVTSFPLAGKGIGEFVQCFHCPLAFGSIQTLEEHLRNQHSNLPGADNPTLAAHLAFIPNGFTPVTSNVMTLPMQQNKVTVQPATRIIKPKPTPTSVTIQNLQDKIKQNLKRDVPRSPSASDSDLAPVTNMMNAADALNFQAFFTPVQITDINSNNTSIAPKKKTPSKLPNILRRPGVQISVEHCKAINRELDNLQREGDVDEDALCQVREMALSVKEECVNSVPASSPAVNPAPAPTVPLSVSPVPSTEPKEDEVSIDSSKEGEKSENPVKKKRNSYADSPHKLSCPYCPRAFPWVSSLTRHLLTHTGQKPFKCPRCPVTFSTKSNRERHLIRKHGVNMLDPLSRQTMDRPYKCPLCVFSSFSTQSNLLKHYRDRHNGANLPDNMYDIERMSPSAIRAATMEMEVRARENPPQFDAFNNTEEDEDDMDNSVDSMEKMDEDSVPYTEMEIPDDIPRPSSTSARSDDSSAPSLAEDQNVPAPESVSEPQTVIAPHLQPILDAAKKSPEVKTEPVEVKQEQDLRRSPSPETMKRNIEKIIAEQRALIQQKAKMEAKIQAEIKAQIDSHRKGDDLSDSSLSLDPAKFMMDMSKPFTGSAERIINPERDNYDVDKIVECWKCNEVFPSRKSLVRHLKEHNIDLPFKCYLCDASFDHRVDCLVHQSDAHDSDWKILKDKNKVGDISVFAMHMDKVVENNCNKLDSGVILEIPGTGIDESKMEVISADYMQRKVYCSLCPKRFWSLQDLRRHMRSHTGERPFECDICQKRFTLKHSMMRHRKKHVGAPPPNFEDDDDSNGADDKSMKSSQPTSTPVFSFSPGTSSEAMKSLGSSFMFTQGLTGGRLTLGGSNIGTLTTALIGASNDAETASTSSSAPEAESKATKTITADTLESVKKEFFDCNADMLHNLLGVESSAIEKMLDSADSKTAAKFLGIQEVS